MFHSAGLCLRCDTDCIVHKDSAEMRKIMAKQKMKTKKSAAKRFKVTGTGKLVRNKAYKSHILTKKSTKRKRNLRQSTLVDETNVKTMKKIMPYI